MAHDPHIYGEVTNKTDLKKIFREIRHDVEEARSRPTLTELYKRAVRKSTARFAQIVEVPEDAQNVQFHMGELPQHYRAALQNVR